MKTTADRIKEGMIIRNMRQADLVEKTGISKGALSSYISGRYTPKQTNTYLIAKALDVNEAWLMGNDVPMERNNHEDQKLLRFDAAFDEARKIIEADGYSLTFADSTDNSIFVITDKKQNVVAHMHDYEIVNKYESLQRNGTVSASDLIRVDEEVWKHYVEKRKEYLHLWNIQCFEKKMLSSFSQLTDDNKKKSISYTENLLSNQKLEEELQLNAAHERTDIEVTDEMKKHDDDIMNDDSLWE